MTVEQAVAFLHAEADRYDAEAVGHRATHHRDESKSVRAKKRAQARALRRAASAIASDHAADVRVSA